MSDTHMSDAAPAPPPKSKEERKKIKKAERRKQKKLDELGTDGIEDNKQARDEGWVDRRMKQLQQTEGVPGDCQLQYLEQHHPSIADYLKGDHPVVADKNLDYHTNRAIFYLGLDRVHTFSTKEHIVKANWALVINCLSGEKPVYPTILVPYCLAIQEFMNTPTTFVDRDTYIKIWMESEYDVCKFSRNETTKFIGQMRELGAALPDIGAGMDFGNMARDLGGALSEDLGEMNQEGEELVAQAEADTADLTPLLGIDDKDLTLEQRMAKQRAWHKDVIGHLHALAIWGKPEARKQHEARIKSLNKSMRLRHWATIGLGYQEEYAAYYIGARLPELMDEST